MCIAWQIIEECYDYCTKTNMNKNTDFESFKHRYAPPPPPLLGSLKKDYKPILEQMGDGRYRLTRYTCPSSYGFIKEPYLDYYDDLENALVDAREALHAYEILTQRATIVKEIEIK